MENTVVQKYLQTCIKEWDEIDDWNLKLVNDFICKYEGLFICLGLFIKGIQVKEGSLKYHETLHGVLGIISLNIEKFRKRCT